MSPAAVLRVLFPAIALFFGGFAPADLWAAMGSTAGRIDVRDFGAIGDGKTLNTGPINQAVAALSQAGGGTLVFGPGTYLTGTIYLRSMVTLQIDAGATILGSTNIADYPENPPPRPNSRLEYGRYALVSAAGQHDVGIIGQGRIYGQGDHTNFTKKDLLARGWTFEEAYLKRPFGLSFVGCQRVTVQGIKFENLAFWCQGYLDCDDVTVRGVSVDSKKHDYNNDGIDLDGCRNVRVSDCYFNVGDDAICLKASYRDCENITITNCTASSLANGVKFGTASNAGFKNIAVSNIVLDGVSAAGIALEIVDGGTMDGVSLSNFAMRNVGTAIFIRLGNNARQWTTGPGKPAIGNLRNVSISQVVAETWSEDDRPLAGSITGLPGYPVENVSISDVRVTARRAFSPERSRVDFRMVPEAAADYAEYSMFGPLPAYGLYVRHVRGLTLRNVQFSFLAEDYRSALVCDDVERLRVDSIQARTLPLSAPIVRLNNVRGAFITGSTAWESVPIFLQVEGTSSGVQVTGNELRAATRPVVFLAPAETITIVP
ncbi:MAG: glycoside hydrolase family 28 protein [Opitutae bacterium]|nr:glycoside hydrolase family 28 protein [Opitutae bacterium]